MTTPAIYRTRIRHVRSSPVRHAFGYRGDSWFVDLDDLPRPPWWLRPFARFDARDHFGQGRTAASGGLRAGLDAVLVEAGLDPTGWRVTALLCPRVLGHVFNPLSLYWCHDRSGTVRCVVAEVHNTYGGRHCYVLHPDASGRAEAAKEFYVSPFNPVEGHYTLRVPEPAQRLAVSVTLHRGGHAPFVASVHGVRRPATASRVLATAFSSNLVSARIRIQGVALWLRGLPVSPRPPHSSTLEVSR
ncbi:DUF1365 domain-containing protein [Rhodococcus sp. NPDC003318]|uniref:DUF1365 domain-containing protein n=1 Tax=Rhodococcus sp. NPDC003318 TaxID=3364503 RepID=UPI003684E292